MRSSTFRSIRYGAPKKLWAPVPWMLEAAILIQIGLGDYVEAGVVGLLLLVNAGLGYFQEGRAQATLDALKSRSALMASVKRMKNAGLRCLRHSWFLATSSSFRWAP